MYLEDINDIANKALLQSKKLLIGISPYSPYSFEFIKKELDILYKAIKNKGILTESDIDNILAKIRNLEYNDNNTIKIINDLMKNALELKYNAQVNNILKNLYNAYFDLDDIYLKKTIDNILERKEIVEKIALYAVNSYRETLEENLDDNIEESKKRFFKKIEELINNNIKDISLKDKYLKIMKDKKIKQELSDIFFDNIEKYEQLVSKYITFSNAEQEENVLLQTLKSNLFKLTDSEKDYEILKEDILKKYDEVHNFDEFYKKVILPSLGKISEDNVEDIYKEIFNIQNVNKIAEDAIKLQNKIKAIESINNGKETFFKIENGEKIEENALEYIKKEIYNNGIDAFKVESSAKYKFNIPFKDMEELTPQEIEELKKKSTDNYYHYTTIGMFYSKHKDSENYINPDGSLNADYFFAHKISANERKFLRCLASAKNPKQSFETTASLTSQCIKEYIQNLEKSYNELNQFLAQNSSAKIVMGLVGANLLIQFYLTYNFLKREKSINNLVEIEKNFYEIKEMAEKLTNKKELQNLNSYVEIISNPKKVNKFIAGKKRADINAVLALAIKDISNYYLNTYPIKKFITEKKEELSKIFSLEKTNELINKNNSKVFSNKLYSLVNMTEEYKKMIALLEVKKDINNQIQKLEEEKNNILEKIKNNINDESKLNELTKELNNIIEKIENIKNDFNKTKDELSRLDYKTNGLDDMKKISESLEKVIEKELLKTKEIKEKIKAGKIEFKDIEKLLNYKKDSEYYQKQINEMMNEVETKYNSKIKKINDFLKKGELIIDDESLNKIANLVFEISDDVIDKLKNIQYIDSKEGQEFMKNILNSSIKIEFLLEQERNIKKIILENMKKYKELSKDEKNQKKAKSHLIMAQYYSAIYDKTLEILDKQYDINKKLYNDIISKVVKADENNLYIKTNNGEYTLPRREIENFEELVKLLKNGNYYELIQTPSIQELEDIFEYVSNKYTFKKDIRKSFYKTNKYHIKEHVLKNNLGVELNFFNGKFSDNINKVKR